METVRKSVKITVTLTVITVAVILTRYWYVSSNADYFDMVKAFMQTKAKIGGVHVFFIDAAFWMSVLGGVIQAALRGKYGLGIISAFWAPLLVMCCLALFFIPENEFTNVYLFWLICYILMIIALWLSARRGQKFCSKNSNFAAFLKKAEMQFDLKVSRIDFIASALSMLASYILLVPVVIGALTFGIGNRNTISWTDDITLAVHFIRYDAAVELMNDKQFEKAMEEFKLLDSYSDSKEMASKCEDMLYLPTYQEGIGLIEQGKYDEARSVFRSIYDYKDSAKKISQCDNLQYGSQYNKAVILMDEGYYEEAIELFEAVLYAGYKDTSEEIDQCMSLMKFMLAGIWLGDAGSRLELMEDLTCNYVDGHGPTGEGTWDVIDGRITVDTDALSYVIYGDIADGYLTTSILFTADTSSWRDEVFTKE